MAQLLGTPKPTPASTPASTPVPTPKPAAPVAPLPAKPAATPSSTPVSTPKPAAPVAPPPAKPSTVSTTSTQSAPPAPPAQPSADLAQARKLYAEAIGIKDRKSPDRLHKLEEAARLAPKNWLYAQQLALEHYKHQQYANAVAEADRSLQLKPNQTMTLTYKGAALLELKQPAEARAANEAALQADPKNNWARYNLALALTAQNDPGAIAAWKDFIAKAENDRVQEKQLRAARQKLAELEQKVK